MYVSRQNLNNNSNGKSNHIINIGIPNMVVENKDIIKYCKKLFLIWMPEKPKYTQENILYRLRQNTDSHRSTKTNERIF